MAYVSPDAVDFCLQERQLTEQHATLDQNTQKLAKSTRAKQKKILEHILKRPWRREQEEVNAAFSKWIRVALFDANGEVQTERKLWEESMARLEQDYAESEKSRMDLEGVNKTLKDLVKKLEENRSTLTKELEASDKTIMRLEKEASKLREERDQLAKEKKLSDPNSCHRGVADQYRMDADHRISQRESEVERKEADLDQREHLLNERDCQATRQLETSQGRIRAMAEQLRRKEIELDAKEKEVAAETARNKTTQARVQELAEMLQTKAAEIERDSRSLSKRMEDCDALESQLTQWQSQLESGRTGDISLR